MKSVVLHFNAGDSFFLGVNDIIATFSFCFAFFALKLMVF